jgi:hypothetical protein
VRRRFFQVGWRYVLRKGERRSQTKSTGSTFRARPPKVMGRPWERSPAPANNRRAKRSRRKRGVVAVRPPVMALAYQVEGPLLL